MERKGGGGESGAVPPEPPLTPVSAAGRKKRPTYAPGSTTPRPVPRRSRRREGSLAC